MAQKNLVVLLLSLLVISAACRQLRGAEADYASDHQRILAELEEVHQLRERMLQQGKACSSVRMVLGSAHCAPLRSLLLHNDICKRQSSL